jgi:hypothetical protein
VDPSYTRRGLCFHPRTNPPATYTPYVPPHRAFDLEKRQHLFANGIFKPLPHDQVGLYGMGSLADHSTEDVQKAEEEIERKWSKKRMQELKGGAEGEVIELEGLGRKGEF